MYLKTPYSYDFYEGEYPVNFEAMKDAPPPVLWFKASGKFSDGVRREDYKVREYVAVCKSLSWRYGLYHLLRPNNITEQAQLFCSVWDAVGGSPVRPVVDVEVDPRLVGITFSIWQSQIKTYLDLVEQHTGKIPIIYTSQYFWSMAYSNGVPPNWTNRYPLWMAWYPDFPDNYSSPPVSKWPGGWTKWAMWQYSEDGRTNGFPGNDLNLLSIWFNIEVTGTRPPDAVDFPFDGVRRTRGVRDDMYEVQILEIARDKIETATVEFNPYHVVENIGGDIVINGGDFNMSTYFPVGLLNSHGHPISPQVDFQPSLGFSPPEISHTKTDWPDAVAGKRYLVVDGHRNPTTSPDWNNREPRTIAGVKANSDLVLVSIKGRNTSAGATLFEVADLMIELGCTKAIDLDGGDSVQARVRDEIFIGSSSRRLVADFVSIKMKGMSNVSYRYNAVSTTHEMSLRTGHSTQFSKITAYPVNTTVYGDEIFTAPVDLKNASGVVYQKAGDIWLLVQEVKGQAVGGWMAIVHMGQALMTLTDTGAPQVGLKHTIEVYSDGSIKVDGQQFP